MVLGRLMVQEAKQQFMQQAYFKTIEKRANEVEPVMLAELQAELNALDDKFTDWDQNEMNVNIDPAEQDLKFNISLIEEFEEATESVLFN